MKELCRISKGVKGEDVAKIMGIVCKSLGYGGNIEVLSSPDSDDIVLMKAETEAGLRTKTPMFGPKLAMAPPDWMCRWFCVAPDASMDALSMAWYLLGGGNGPTSYITPEGLRSVAAMLHACPFENAAMFEAKVVMWCGTADRLARYEEWLLAALSADAADKLPPMPVDPRARASAAADGDEDYELDEDDLDGAGDDDGFRALQELANANG